MDSVSIELPAHEFAALLSAALRGPAAWRTGAATTLPLISSITTFKVDKISGAALVLAVFEGWGWWGTNITLMPATPLWAGYPLPDVTPDILARFADGLSSGYGAEHGSDSSDTKARDVGLGVGLGVGLPLLAVAAVAGWVLMSPDLRARLYRKHTSQSPSTRPDGKNRGNVHNTTKNASKPGDMCAVCVDVVPSNKSGSSSAGQGQGQGQQETVGDSNAAIMAISVPRNGTRNSSSDSTSTEAKVRDL